MEMPFFKLVLLSLGLFSTIQGYNWSSVEDKIQYYLGNGAFPGGILRVANSTHNIYTSTFGSYTHITSPSATPPFTNNTMFDIASLTKVSATLTCIMHLYQQQMLGIDDLVTKYLPQYGNGKEMTTIKNLLLHNAGLLPDYPSPLPSTKEEVIQFIYNCKLNYPIGTKFVYSDLSFISLGLIVEAITGHSLQDYTAKLMIEMDMRNSTFLPSRDNWHRVAPTEFSVARKSLIRGQVHDPTAYLFGGVAGHAGFFSVAEDLELYMQIHLNNGKKPNGQEVYKETTVKTFYTRVDGLPYNNRRALSWDTVPIQTNPPCGHFFSLNSFGHTGFTGTMMWADREKNLIVVFLTNRVHPTAQNSLISEARAEIVDQIVRVMGLI